MLSSLIGAQCRKQQFKMYNSISLLTCITYVYVFAWCAHNAAHFVQNSISGLTFFTYFQIIVITRKRSQVYILIILLQGDTRSWWRWNIITKYPNIIPIFLFSLDLILRMDSSSQRFFRKIFSRYNTIPKPKFTSQSGDVISFKNE